MPLPAPARQSRRQSASDSPEVKQWALEVALYGRYGLVLAREGLVSGGARVSWPSCFWPLYRADLGGSAAYRVSTRFKCDNEKGTIQ